MSAAAESSSRTLDIPSRDGSKTLRLMRFNGDPPVLLGVLVAGIPAGTFSLDRAQLAELRSWLENA